MTAALITARGGSKRLPRKNVRPFCGIPLFAWSVIQAQSSHYIDQVYVSTDDDEIAQITEEYGANLIRRPDWPDADLASAGRPMMHGIMEIQRQYGINFDTFIGILPTGPLNLPGDFDKAIEIYRASGCDSIGPMRPMRETVLWQKMGPNRARMKIFDKHYRYLMEASCWNVTSPRRYMWGAKYMEDDHDSIGDAAAEGNTEQGGESYFFPVEPWQYADCDTLAEFELGECIMEKFILKGQGRKVYDDYAALKTKPAGISVAAGNLNQQ